MSLALAETLFSRHCVTITDDRFNYGERRTIVFGRIGERMLACVYIDRNAERRVISLRKANPQELRRYGAMANSLSKAAREALASTDWSRVDAMTDADIMRQIGSNSDAAPDLAPDFDVRAIRQATGMTQAQFAATYEFSIRTIQEWESGSKRPSGPAGTLLRAIKGDPEAIRKALAAA